MNYSSSQPDYGKKHIPSCRSATHYRFRLYANAVLQWQRCFEISSKHWNGSQYIIIIAQCSLKGPVIHVWCTHLEEIAASFTTDTILMQCRLEMKRVFHIHSKHFSLFYFKRERNIELHEINSKYISMRLQWTVNSER